MSELDNILGEMQPPSALERVASTLRSVGHKAAMLPIPFLNAAISFPLTFAAAVLDSTDSFLNKGIRTGVKSTVAGTADVAVTNLAATMPLFWLGSWGTALASKDTLGELARKGTKGVMDAIIADSKTAADIAREAQVLGPAPMTIGHVPAGIGMAPAPMQQQQIAVTPVTQAQAAPNQWTDMVAGQRGQSAEQARESWVRNNHEEALALQHATQGEQQLGAS